MATSANNVIRDEDLSAADKAILEVLRDGRATKGYLVDETGYPVFAELFQWMSRASSPGRYSWSDRYSPR